MNDVHTIVFLPTASENRAMATEKPGTLQPNLTQLVTDWPVSLTNFGQRVAQHYPRRRPEVLEILRYFHKHGSHYSGIYER